jgi:cyanate lyase
MSKNKTIKQVIMNQLSLGACCRIHLHRECCVALGLSVESQYNEKNQRIRICKELPDNQFDRPFEQLLREGLVQKVPTEKSVYAFYELTEKGKNFKIISESSGDSAINKVKELRDKGDLIASFLLCSTLIEHYCRTRLFVTLMDRRPSEIIQITKERKAFIWSKLEEIVFNPYTSQSKIIDIGLLVKAWNYDLYNQLKQFNKKRNIHAHQYENLFKIMKRDEKEVRDIIEQGISLLHNIKLGYVKY